MKMELYKLKIETRPKLYFNKYRYRARFYLKNASYAHWGKNWDNFLELDKRICLKNTNYDLIKSYLNFIHINKSEIIARAEGSNVSIFTNKLELYNQLHSIVNEFDVTEVCLTPKVIIFKNIPKYKFRVYLKSKFYSKDDKYALLDFGSQNRQSCKLSNGLLIRCSTKTLYQKEWFHNSYYIEFNDESFYTYLRLMFPDYLRNEYFKLIHGCEKDKYSINMECLNGQSS